jgi:short-subunit dehydrogenase
MVERRRGGFVVMSSVASGQGGPRLATYAATKAFGAVWAQGLWSELRPKGVDVVACCAGAVATPNLAGVSARRAPGTLAPGAVVDAALDALGGGPRVVPGAVNRVAVGVLSLLPRRAAVAVMARAAADLSAEAPST